MSAPRVPLIAGNWKLNLGIADSVALALSVRNKLRRSLRAEVVIAPVFTALHAVHQALGDGSQVRVAAQNCYWEDHGAFTGEVGPAMLKDVGCELAIVGHSERRHLLGETDEQVRRKVGALMSHGVVPIVCVGETLEQREANETEVVVLGQLDAALSGLGKGSFRDLVVAYEPVWAIGTGRTAAPSDAQAVHAAIRRRVTDRFGDDAGQDLRILYGGSVKASNAAALLAEADIDGALVGGASLDAPGFVAIAEAAG